MNSFTKVPEFITAGSSPTLTFGSRLAPNHISISEFIANAKNDESLKSTINIDALLAAVANIECEHLDNKTLSDISSEIFCEFQEMGLAKEQIIEYCAKLIEYRLINQIYQLHKGKHIRWIRRPNTNTNTNHNLSLTNGGIVVDIKFLDNGTHVLCKNKMRFIQYKFDDCITFQKLSSDEQLLLSCYEIAQKK